VPATLFPETNQSDHDRTGRSGVADAPTEREIHGLSCGAQGWAARIDALPFETVTLPAIRIDVLCKTVERQEAFFFGDPGRSHRIGKYGAGFVRWTALSPCLHPKRNQLDITDHNVDLTWNARTSATKREFIGSALHAASDAGTSASLSESTPETIICAITP
jgi:hypothetical protein